MVLGVGDQQFRITLHTDTQDGTTQGLIDNKCTLKRLQEGTGKGGCWTCMLGVRAAQMTSPSGAGRV